MLTNRSRFLLAASALLFLLISSLSPCPVNAQIDTGTQALTVGVVSVPPLAMKTPAGQWTGFSIELWKAVADDAGYKYEFLEFANLQLLLSAIESKQIDVIPCLPVRERFEPRMDFSQSYFKSGLSIAVPGQGHEFTWRRIFQGMFSFQMLKAITFLFFVSLLAGGLVWVFERKPNAEMFGGKPIQGIGHGVWWAIVTMATVGYGDKAPRTLAGRAVALVWIVFSLVFLSCFTATITTSLTVGELKGKVRGFDDLYDARVGVVAGSEGQSFLSKNGIATVGFDTIQDGLADLAAKKIDAFVQDEHLLTYTVKREFAKRAQILPHVYDEYFVSIALQDKSPHRKLVNRALLRFMQSEKWSQLVSHYYKVSQ
jgi:polar amino acid transport system substrate-binding protein